MKKPYAIGIDIGGTKISMVAGDARGRIFAAHEIPTRKGRQASRCVHAMAASLKSFVADPRLRHKICGVGIGIPGAVDTRRGMVPHSPNLKGWKGVPLRKILQSALRLPVILANDANAAAVGEKIFGQGKNISDFIYITVSTGIGGGIVVGGKLLDGVSYVAGEVGHMTLVPKGDRCKCGKLGCLEAYASGTAMAAYAKKHLSQKELQRIKKFSPGEPFAAKVLGRAARNGNRAAIQVYERGGFYLGIGIANLLNILNPQKVILGGGVFKSAPKQFWESMLASCKSNAWPEAFKAVQIVPSKLRGHVGNLGALALAFENQKTEVG